MCGIIGVFSDRVVLSTRLLDQLRDTMRHRGPAMGGNFQDRGLYLGFRRLAILDLSTQGNQPMTSDDGRYTLVFNGEIYNYVELRAELERQGEVFRGSSDTEVLLHLYAKHGHSCLDILNGMYAFCIYDNVERTLLLVRDRMGVKPLFYWKQGQVFAFASEIRALRGLPDFSTAIDLEALGLYFRLGTVPEWTSIYPSVTKLPPGSWIRYHLGSGRMEGPVAYWDLPPVGEEEGRSEDDWVDEIEALLWDATRIRLRSDVPLGLFLSGGIDSGLVAAAAARYRPGLSALTIGFAGEAEDEVFLAQATASQLGMKSIVRNIDLRQCLEMLPSIIGHFDEPFSDTSALPVFLVCAEARKDLTVVLSGDGGDEVFGGYGNHVRAWKWRVMEHLPLALRHLASNLLTSLVPDDSRLMRFFNRLGQPVGRFGLGGKIYPFQDWLKEIINPDLFIDPGRVVQLYNQHLPKWAGATSSDLAQRTDLRSYMLEDILVKVDRMSMLNSLEVRSPFLDYRLVELGLRVPSELRTKNNINKYLLRRLAARHLPVTVFKGPKRGFGIPLHSLLKGDSSKRVLETTLASTPDGHLDPFVKGGAARLWRKGQTNQALTSAVFQLLCYRWWCLRS